MGEGTKVNPYTREDIIELVKNNENAQENLDLTGAWFETGINLRGLDLAGVIMKKSTYSRHILMVLIWRTLYLNQHIYSTQHSIHLIIKSSDWTTLISKRRG